MSIENDPKLIRAPKLSEQIAHYLQAEISEGSLGVGEKLPSEAILCKRFGVSRTVVREATARLEFDGYIETKQGTRNVVSKAYKKKAFRIDQATQLNFEELAQLYEFRIIIEAAAVVLATKRCGTVELQSLKECLKEMAKADINSSDGIPANVTFHQIIAKASGNKFLSDFMVFLNDKITAMLEIDKKAANNTAIVESIHNEHKSIVSAIKQKDPQKARTSIVNHIRNAAKRQGVELEPF
jgi:GntR family transcriptional repressor for pyruvate dehydrogenase complex